ncbi:N-acetyltransferase family protein [Paenibacillus marinisediminis]
MNIRLAHTYDIPSIKELYLELIADMTELQPSYLSPAAQDDAFIANMIIAENASFLLLEDSERIIGFVLVQELDTPSHDQATYQRYAYLTDLVITNRYRSQGLGTHLLEAAKQWAKRRNLDYIELDVLSENTPAIQLYERYSFTETMRTMRCSLDT